MVKNPGIENLLRLAAGLLALAAVLPGAAAVRQVTVAAAPVERAAMVVTLTLPRELANGAILRDAAGQIVPLQAEADLAAKFIVARQAANQTLRFTLEPGRAPELGNVQVVEEPSPPRPGAAPGIAAAAGAAMIQTKTGRLRVSVGGRPVLYYQMDRDAVPRDDIDPKLRRAGYLHPVYSPSGQVVTGDFVLPGLNTHGISSALDETDPDAAKVTTKVEFGGIDSTWSGPVHGGFVAWTRALDLSKPDQPVRFEEAWELTVYANPAVGSDLRLFDLKISRTGDELPDLNEIWLNTPGGSSLLRPVSSEESLFAANRWVGFRLLGRAAASPADQEAGLVILNPAEIEGGAGGLSAMNGFMVIWNRPKPATPAPKRISWRQRFVVFDGPPDKALLEALWNGYTVPAVVSVTPAP